MAILPTRGYSHQALNVLTEVKKGNKQALGEFVWQNQERFFAIALIATGSPDVAVDLTINAFGRANQAISHLNTKNMQGAVWPWLCQFIIESCADYHHQMGGQPARGGHPDPSMDGSGDLNWMEQAHISSQRLKRCLSMIPQQERNTFILRQQLGLTYEQIAIVLNRSMEEVMGDLFRSRVLLFKCLCQRAS